MRSSCFDYSTVVWQSSCQCASLHPRDGPYDPSLRLGHTWSTLILCTSRIAASASLSLRPNYNVATPHTSTTAGSALCLYTYTSTLLSTCFAKSRQHSWAWLANKAKLIATVTAAFGCWRNTYSSRWWRWLYGMMRHTCHNSCIRYLEMLGEMAERLKLHEWHGWMSQLRCSHASVQWFQTDCTRRIHRDKLHLPHKSLRCFSVPHIHWPSSWPMRFSHCHTHVP